MGGDINGEAEGDAAGRSVTINADGTIVAIGAIYNDHDSGIDSGHVRVYQYAGNTWTQLGQDIDGVGDSARFGVDVALSDDGMVLAVGSRYDSGGGTSSGAARIYGYSSGSWVQLGSDLQGEAVNDSFGFKVDLNSDGTVVAVSARDNDGAGSGAGHVRVFEYANNDWNQLGADIDGEAANDQFRYSVALDSMEIWLQLGPDIMMEMEVTLDIREYFSMRMVLGDKSDLILMVNHQMIDQAVLSQSVTMARL